MNGFVIIFPFEFEKNQFCIGNTKALLAEIFCERKVRFSKMIAFQASRVGETEMAAAQYLNKFGYEFGMIMFDDFCQKWDRK